jgi:hypothetical protein
LSSHFEIKFIATIPTGVSFFLLRLTKKPTKIQTKFPWIENLKPTKNLLQLSRDRSRRSAGQSGSVLFSTNAIDQYLLKFVRPQQLVLILYIGTFPKSITENVKEMQSRTSPEARPAWSSEGRITFSRGREARLGGQS